MIRSLRGKIIGLNPPQALVEVGGVGYGPYLPISDFTKLAIDQNVFLFTYHHATENRQELYGFLSSEERNFFELLLGVSGVGPKSALSIIGAHDLSLLQSAVTDGNASVFKTAPGVGGKTAERIIIDLKNKVNPSSSTSVGYEDVYDALLSLGYKAVEINKVLSQISQEHEKDTASQLRLALKALGKR